jgi:hypothetical protein
VQNETDAAIEAARECYSIRVADLAESDSARADTRTLFGRTLTRGAEASGDVAKAREAVAVLRDGLESTRRANAASWAIEDARSTLGAAITLEASLDRDSTLESRDARFGEARDLLESSAAALADAEDLPEAVRTDRRRQALARVVRLFEKWNEIEPDQGHDQRAEAARARLRDFDKAARSSPR